VMTGRVVEEVAIVGGEKCGIAESRHARATGVAQMSGRLNHEALVARKVCGDEACPETGGEVDVLPPGRRKGRIETTEGLPHGSSHQPGGGGRLCDLDRCRRLR